MLFKYVLKKNLLVIVVIITLGFISVIVSESLYKANVYECISNNLYSNSNSHFIQMEDIELKELISISNNTFVSKELNERMRGIYFSKDYSYKLPVIKGRFFNYEDFKLNNNYVVVGKKLEKYLYYKNKKQMFSFKGKEYEVIGILGMNSKSIIDYFVLFNINNIFSYAPKKTKIVLGNPKEDVLNKLNNYNNTNLLKPIEIENAGISRVWSTTNIYYLITICVYILLIITVIFLFMIKSNFYTNYLKIFKLLGFSKNFIYRKLILYEIFICLLTYLLSIIIAIVFIHKQYYIDRNLITDILKLIFISCFLFMLSSFYLFWIKYKKNA